MIKILPILFFTFSLFAKSDICVSIPPEAFFVQKIAGDQAEVTVLIPPGSSPATYTPKPSQLRAIKKASLYFTIGVPFEQNWLKRFKSINPSLQIIDITKGIQKRPMNHTLEEGDHEEEHHHGTLDPHVWLSPKLAIVLAKNIKEALSQTDPDHRELYEKNLKKFAQEANGLHEEIMERLKSLPFKTFIVFHPSFGYFADEFGLRQVAIEKEGKEPTLKYIQRVIDFARKHHIHTIFTEPQFSQKSARYIAKHIGGNVVSIDPLSQNWDTNLREITRSFEKATSHPR
ncbi:MAG: cation ABC transporter substrate-binding protein [Sulfurospirillum sp.]|nr:MAG: cation ABC transporter substrate-binding protein [Sulfurospirillum sp.]